MSRKGSDDGSLNKPNKMKRYLDGFILLVFTKTKQFTSFGICIFTFDTKNEEYDMMTYALFSYVRRDNHYTINFLFIFVKEWRS